MIHIFINSDRVSGIVPDEVEDLKKRAISGLLTLLRRLMWRRAHILHEPINVRHLKRMWPT